VAVIAAGYDDRPLRYGKPGVRWFEVDHPDTQRDKRARLARLGIQAPQITFVGFDLRDQGLADALTESGFEAEASSLIPCEGAAVYLDRVVLEALLRQLRSLATTGTRLAASFSANLTAPEASAGRERFRRTAHALGEPALSDLSAGRGERRAQRRPLARHGGVRTVPARRVRDGRTEVGAHRGCRGACDGQPRRDPDGGDLPPQRCRHPARPPREHLRHPGGAAAGAGRRGVPRPAP
jgi:methyltransferase (TIGR00027 family)